MKYTRYVSAITKVVSWKDENNQNADPQLAIKLEQQFLDEHLHRKAAKHAGLPWPFDTEEEKYYQSHRVELYLAYIAGYMEALKH